MRDAAPKSLLVSLLLASHALATPVNKAGLERHYDRFLGPGLGRCDTCHQPSDRKDPQNLEEFPHNAFGDRLRKLGEELEAQGKKADIAARLTLVANEDADGDGVDNETELLAGGHPGDASRTPALPQDFAKRRAEFAQHLASYHWRPFEPVQRPAVPVINNKAWVRNPIDAFIAAEHEARGLTPRPQAQRTILLRRVYLDLIGIQPTPEEQRAFESDTAPDAYERVVDRLLADPRYGERWGRHWMDVWRYSDWAGWTDGNQIRDSQRHIWRWRDWIVEALNEDRAYDRMVIDMLAADELSPGDPSALRATGFLARNYKMLSREQWLEDTVKHTAQAFLGVTLGCAKCHDHRTDPISQTEYYQVRAIFEPHQVRTDRVPGELDIAKAGLVRVYDAEKPAPTYLFRRGNEQQPDKSREITPAVPRALAGKATSLAITPVALPREAAFPDRREFVVKDVVTDSEKTFTNARTALQTGKPEQKAELELALAAAEAKHAALLATVAAEKLEERVGTDEWKALAREAVAKQRAAAVADAKLALHKARTIQSAHESAVQLSSSALTQAQLAQKQSGVSPADLPRLAETERKAAQSAEKARAELTAAGKKTAEAEAALANTEKAASAELTTQYTPRAGANNFPATSTGRRSAFAKWIASADNPLTARVAMNHIWLRHFGRGIIATPENLGTGGAQPSHPALLDWLASEFIERRWSMKAMHRLIVTSSTYRMASTPDAHAAALDADNVWLWKMPSRRMEAEIVRDNILASAGSLDLTMGGPDIDCKEGLTSPRRSIYLRSAAEKEVEFLKIFDGPSVNECYQRRASVMPQQALALANSELAMTQSKALAARITGDDPAFVRGAFERILARTPTPEEFATCAEFLKGKPASGREQLILVIFNHNDFVTIR